jgi:hypothetical protein
VRIPLPSRSTSALPSSQARAADGDEGELAERGRAVPGGRDLLVAILAIGEQASEERTSALAPWYMPSTKPNCSALSRTW